MAGFCQLKIGFGIVLFQGGLKDVDHSWLETQRIGSSWTFKMMLVVAKGAYPESLIKIVHDLAENA